VGAVGFHYSKCSVRLVAAIVTIEYCWKNHFLLPLIDSLTTVYS